MGMRGEFTDFESKSVWSRLHLMLTENVLWWIYEPSLDSHYVFSFSFFTASMMNYPSSMFKPWLCFVFPTLLSFHRTIFWAAVKLGMRRCFLLLDPSFKNSDSDLWGDIRFWLDCMLLPQICPLFVLSVNLC